MKLYAQTTLEFGVMDILSNDSVDPVMKVAAFATLMCLARRNPSEEPLIREVVAVLPPAEALASLNHESIIANVLKTAEQHFGRTLQDDEKNVFNERIKIIHADDLRLTSVIKSLDSVSDQSAVIVVAAASYRDEQIASQPVSRLTLKLPEDTWIPHLVKLGQSAIELAKHHNYYLLLETGEAPPHKQQNKEALNSIPDCGVFTWTPENEGASIIASQVSGWQEAIENGNVGSAFKSIEALPEWMNSQKSYLKLQLLERVAPGNAVMDFFRSEINTNEITDPKARLKLARIAQRAGDEEVAREMLMPAISELLSQEDLEAALDAATRLADDAAISETRIRLQALYPHSTDLLTHRLTDLIDERKYVELSSLLQAEGEQLELPSKFFYQTLASALQTPSSPEYDRALTAIEQAVPEKTNRARFICAREALERSDFWTAMNLCFSSDRELQTASTAGLLLRILRQLLLQRDEHGDLPISGNQLQDPIFAVIRYVASHPNNGGLRMALTDVLSAETSGSLGLTIIVATTLRLAESGVAVSSDEQKHDLTREDVELDIDAFVKNAMEWMAEAKPVILGVTKLPARLLTAKPDNLLSALKQTITFDKPDLRDLQEAKGFENLVFLGALLAAHTSDPNDDIDLIRYSGARLIAGNRLQRGRDLAEQALVIAGSTPERRRLASMVRFC